MRGFNGKLDEMEAAKYLLKNGEVLKKMTIYTHDPLRPKEELYKELWTCQRGSETCQVEVIWDAVIMVLNRFRYPSCKSIIFVCTRWMLAVLSCRILLSTLNFRVIQLWWHAKWRMCMVWFLWFFFSEKFDKQKKLCLFHTCIDPLVLWLTSCSRTLEETSWMHSSLLSVQLVRMFVIVCLWELSI